MFDYKINRLAEFAQHIENLKIAVVRKTKEEIEKSLSALILELGKIDEDIGPTNLNVIVSLLESIGDSPDDKLRLRIDRAIQEVRDTDASEPGCLSDVFVEHIRTRLP